jgi:hypothetical protein
MARRPLGTVTAKENVALSAGWSLQGNQPGAPRGSLITIAPSRVGIQPGPSATPLGRPR